MAAARQGVQILHLIASLETSDTAITRGALADRLGIDRGNFNRYAQGLGRAG